MRFSTKSIQILLQAPVGPMNDLRRQKIGEAIEPPYVVGSVNQMPNVTAVADQNGGEIIFIGDQQLDYRKEDQRPGADLSSDLTQAVQLLDTVRTTLLLDDRMPGMLQIIGYMDSDKPTTELSVEYFTSMTAQELRSRFPGLRGVGLRVTFDQPPYNCDVHVEPYFVDASVFYVRFSAQFTNPMVLSRLVQDGGRFFDYLQTDVIKFIQDMMSE